MPTTRQMPLATARGRKNRQMLKTRLNMRWITRTRSLLPLLLSKDTALQRCPVLTSGLGASPTCGPKPRTQSRPRPPAQKRRKHLRQQKSLLRRRDADASHCLASGSESGSADRGVSPIVSQSDLGDLIACKRATLDERVADWFDNVAVVAHNHAGSLPERIELGTH